MFDMPQDGFENIMRCNVDLSLTSWSVKGKKWRNSWQCKDCSILLWNPRPSSPPCEVWGYIDNNPALDLSKCLLWEWHFNLKSQSDVEPCESQSEEPCGLHRGLSQVNLTEGIFTTGFQEFESSNKNGILIGNLRCARRFNVHYLIHLPQNHSEVGICASILQKRKQSQSCLATCLYQNGDSRQSFWPWIPFFFSSDGAYWLFSSLNPRLCFFPSINLRIPDLLLILMLYQIKLKNLYLHLPFCL